VAKAFDLRKQLALHDNQLLRKLFKKVPAMKAVDWDSLGEHEVQPLIEAWEAMEEDRQKYQVILQDVNEFSEERNQRLLMEDLRCYASDCLPEVQKWKSGEDKALWTFLHQKVIFEQASLFAPAESLRSGQMANRWHGLVVDEFDSSDEKIAALEELVRDHYWNKEHRGRHCKVHHYTRPDGAEYFFAYLPDWPEKRMALDAQDEVNHEPRTFAFCNVFIYEPATGVLEVIAKGGKAVYLPLRRAFCSAVLGIEVDDEVPDKPVYKIDHLLEPAFSLATDPADRIAEVRIKQLRFLPKQAVVGMQSFEARFHDRANQAEVNVAIDRILGAFKLSRPQVSVAQVSFQIQMMGDGQKKGRKMTFHVNRPNTCDLKSKPDDMRVVGERCLRKWGVVND
jgi:hypothetical protein